MKKFLGMAVLVALSSVPVLAQGRYIESTPKFEVGGGYTYRSWGVPGNGNRLSMNGWNATATYNVNNWLGAAFDIHGTYNHQGVNGDQTIYTFLFGPRIYPMGHGKLAPFVHGMVGDGRYLLFLPASGGFPAFNFSENDFAFDFGGGIDATVTNRVAIRIAQVDYERTMFSVEQDLPAQNNFKYSMAVIFRFGEK